MTPMVHRRRMWPMSRSFSDTSPLIRSRRSNPMVFVVLLGSFIFTTITASLYYYLPMYQQQNPHHGTTDNSGFPSITIYTAPRPFSSKEDMVDRRQVLAVRSWLSLSQNVDVVLFGQHPSIHKFASTLGPRVTVESAIDFTFLGTPFFHCMITRSQTSNSSISVLIDPETILLPDIITTLHYAYKLNRDWFLVSMSSNIMHLPFHLDDIGWLRDGGEKIEVEKLQEFSVQQKNSSCCGRRLIMAWNTGDLPLHTGVLPSFLYGKGLHNEWLLNEVLSSGFRFVFDSTQVISSFYPESLGKWPSNLSNFSVSGSKHDREGIGNPIGGSERDWEDRGNQHLAALYGSLNSRLNNISYKPSKLIKCLRQYFFINPLESTMYSLQGSYGHASYDLKPVLGQEKHTPQLLTRLLRSQRKKIACEKEVRSWSLESQCSVMELYKVTTAPVPVSFPFTLESLLQMVADKDNTVVLAIAGDNYRDMLMSWVCRLRLLAVTNFIVCALDQETYEFSILQGLPVFKDPLAPNHISFNDCHFGTKCFQRVTKVKSRIVLQILKLGYNVLLSDVDVYWFDNPLRILCSFGPAVLVAQSDEYNKTGPINLPRRLNSGFYFARSDPATIASMEKVVKHASASSLSEQPSFYDVLCGEGGVNRLGVDRCLEPNTNLTVYFLDRKLFPNGAYKGLWEKRDVKSACLKLGCIILHNNWISGRKRKLERQVRSGLWDYDSSSRMCLQSWHRR